jgi:hypothetical protein
MILPDKVYLSETLGVFPTGATWIIFFLNRMNSRQGIVKKEQEIIFKISAGSIHYFNFF